MALRRERMRLGDILIKQNVLTEEQLKQALELQKGSGKKIGEVLVDSGIFLLNWIRTMRISCIWRWLIQWI